MKEDCPLCFPSQPHQQLEIADFGLWKVSLHDNQYYPGRALIILNRHLEICQLNQLTTAEQLAFYQIAGWYWQVVSEHEQLKATLPNISFLGNEFRHIHGHLIPRYDHPVDYQKTDFVDSRWGSNYVPYPKGFHLPPAVLKEIVQDLRTRLLTVAGSSGSSQ